MSYSFSPSCQLRSEDLNRIFTKAWGPKLRDGWFVEVGASDGEHNSNTSGLARSGWHGLYFEPVPYLANQCRERYKNFPRIVTCNLAIGEDDLDDQPIWFIHEWGMATLNHYASTFQGAGKPSEQRTNVRKLDTMLNECAWPTGFELLVIDTDWGEIGVLKGFDIKHWKPKLVIIELHEGAQQPLSYPIQEFAYPYFEEAGYNKIYEDPINSIFEVR